MDHDVLATEFQKLKARVEPMLKAYEDHVQGRLVDPTDPRPFETGVTDENRDEIYAPLDKPKLAEGGDSGTGSNDGPETDAAYAARIMAERPDLSVGHKKAVSFASGQGLDDLGKAVGLDRK